MLLETVAGVAPADAGSVRFDGVDLHANLRKFRGVIGYVPQDDIIHADLSLRHTLRYAARLRLPSSTTAAEIDEAVAAAIATVGLGEQAEVRVGSLSGGQRKASQHRSRAADPTSSVLPGRADLEPRSGCERTVDCSPCAGWPQFDDGRVHHAFDRRPRAVRSSRLHGARRTSRLRRHRRGGTAGLRGRLASGDLRLAGRGRPDPLPDAADECLLRCLPRPPLKSARRPVANGLTQWAVS